MEPALGNRAGAGLAAAAAVGNPPEHLKNATDGPEPVCRLFLLDGLDLRVVRIRQAQGWRKGDRILPLVGKALKGRRGAGSRRQ
ncbi:hypothetical protein D3C78_1718640 [compost metagenome]